MLASFLPHLTVLHHVSLRVNHHDSCCKLLHVGLLSELRRKSLPAIAAAVGDADGQRLHHLVADGSWSLEALRERRLALTRRAVGGRAITVCLDATGGRTKGSTTA